MTVSVSCDQVLLDAENAGSCLCSLYAAESGMRLIKPCPDQQVLPSLFTNMQFSCCVFTVTQLRKVTTMLEIKQLDFAIQ